MHLINKLPKHVHHYGWSWSKRYLIPIVLLNPVFVGIEWHYKASNSSSLQHLWWQRRYYHHVVFQHLFEVCFIKYIWKFTARHELFDIKHWWIHAARWSEKRKKKKNSPLVTPHLVDLKHGDDEGCSDDPRNEHSIYYLIALLVQASGHHHHHVSPWQWSNRHLVIRLAEVKARPDSWRHPRLRPLPECILRIPLLSATSSTAGERWKEKDAEYVNRSPDSENAEEVAAGATTRRYRDSVFTRWRFRMLKLLNYCSAGHCDTDSANLLIVIMSNCWNKKNWKMEGWSGHQTNFNYCKYFMKVVQQQWH